MQGLKKIERVFSVLSRLAAEKEALSFTELSDGAEKIAAPTLSRILSTLLNNGYIIKNQKGRYELGEAFYRLARTTLQVHRLKDIVDPVLHDLSGDLGHSSAFAVWKDDHIVFQTVNNVPNGMHLQEAGKPIYRIFTNSFAQACIAFQPEEEWPKIHSLEVQTYGRQGLAEMKTLWKEIRQEPVRVFFQDPRTRIIAPVFAGEKGRFLGALGISYFQNSQTHAQQEAFKETVLGCARKLTRWMEET